MDPSPFARQQQQLHAQRRDHQPFQQQRQQEPHARDWQDYDSSPSDTALVAADPAPRAGTPFVTAADRPSRDDALDRGGRSGGGHVPFGLGDELQDASQELASPAQLDFTSSPVGGSDYRTARRISVPPLATRKASVSPPRSVSPLAGSRSPAPRSVSPLAAGGRLQSGASSRTPTPTGGLSPHASSVGVHTVPARAPASPSSTQIAGAAAATRPVPVRAAQADDEASDSGSDGAPSTPFKLDAAGPTAGPAAPAAPLQKAPAARSPSSSSESEEERAPRPAARGPPPPAVETRHLAQGAANIIGGAKSSSSSSDEEVPRKAAQPSRPAEIPAVAGLQRQASASTSGDDAGSDDGDVGDLLAGLDGPGGGGARHGGTDGVPRMLAAGNASSSRSSSIAEQPPATPTPAAVPASSLTGAAVAAAGVSRRSSSSSGAASGAASDEGDDWV